MDEQLICKKCGSEGARKYPLVTIRTMTVRSGRKTLKYQALGEILSINLCQNCIDAWISERSKPKAQYLKALKVPLLLFLVAAAVQFLGLDSGIRWVITLLFAGFGLAVFISEFSRIRRETQQIGSGQGVFTRDHMVEELAASLLPPKHNDASLTYLLKKRVMNEKAHDSLCREYGISRKKLVSIREYLLTTPEAEANKVLKGSEDLDRKKKKK